MERVTVLRRIFCGKSLWRQGCKAYVSTIVPVGGSTPYPLPLTLLPSTTSSSLLPLSRFPVYAVVPKHSLPAAEDSLKGDKPPWHVTTFSSPTAIELHHVRPNVASFNPTFEREFKNEMPRKNTSPPKPEKPKWEEEQYPDIGKTIDIVSNHLPFLLIQPLPKNILSPNIELRLFPTTHPSLPTLRLGRFAYRTFFRAVRWVAPVLLNRTLRSFGKPSGPKGIGLEITSLRVTKIENGRRIEARWRTSSSPWTAKPESSAPTNTAEAMPKTWSGWFYFDIDRKGLVVRHIVENVNNQREEERENKLKDILARTVTNGRALEQGFGSVREKVMGGVSTLQIGGSIPKIFPPPTASTIFVSARTYC